MNVGSSTGYLIMTAVICIFMFFFVGGGSLIDKWIDGARKKRNDLLEVMPNWSLKILRILSYFIYAAFVLYVLYLIVKYPD